MSITYNYRNFDGSTLGTLPSNLLNIATGTAGTPTAFAVSNTGAVSGANGLADSSGSLSGGVIEQALGATADHCIQFRQTVNLNGSGQGAVCNIILRCSGAASGSQGLYSLGISFNANTIAAYRFGSGAFSAQVGSNQSLGITATNGQVYWCKAEIQGSVSGNIRFKIWLNGTSEPSSWTVTFTDANVTAAGYPGIAAGYNNGALAGTIPAFDDLFVGPAGSTFALPSLSISPSSFTQGSSGNNFTITGTNTHFSANSETITASVGTVISQTVASDTSITGTYTAPGSGSTVTLTDATYGPISTSATLSAGSGNATGYSLSASPSSVATGSACTITATLTGGTTLSASLVITLTDSAASTISGTITITNGNTTGTATVTPSASGTHSITASHTGGGFTGGDGSTSFTATISGTSIAPNASGLVYVGRWSTPNSTNAITITNGALCRFVLTGYSSMLTLRFDVSTVTSSNYPVIVYWVDGVGPTRTQLTSTGTLALTIPSQFSSQTTHRVEFTANIYSGYPTNVDNWDNQTDALKFTGITADSGASLLAIPANPNTIEFLGDSITAGLRVLYTGTNGNLYDAVESSWALQVARTLGLDPILFGHGGVGITVAATDGTPAANSSFGYVYNGVAWNPVNKPVAVWVYMGTNDGSGFTQSQYQTYLTTIRAAYPLALIFAVVPYNESGQASTVQSAVTAQADANVVYLNYSSSFTSSDVVSDGTHFNEGGAAKMAALAASAIQSKFNTLNYRLQSPVGLTVAQLNSALASGVTTLASNGLDNITVESGVNARQALSPILAAAAGAITGNGTSTVLAKAPGTATTRITATMTGLDRTATTLSLPS